MKGLISWFVHNPVAANLLMFILVVGGALTLPNLHKEEFPNIDTDIIQVQVPYLGAAPLEVEQSVCIRIEEAIDGVEGIDKISTIAAEGLCTVNAELPRGASKGKVLDDIKTKVDSIDTFPVETEKPVVAELSIIANVLIIAISGEADERTLKNIGQEIRDEIVELPEVSQVELRYVRPYEISIEVSEYTLRRYGLTLSQVADAIRSSSLDIPGGSVKTEAGEILIRTKAQAYVGQDFEKIAVLTRNDGTSVILGEIANVIDGFRDTDLRARFDGKPAVIVDVKRVGEEDVLRLAKRVKEYLLLKQPQLPEGIDITIWKDESQDLVDRLDVLSTNALGGLALVLIVLALFLRFRLAIWVAAGILIAVMGTVMTFPVVGITISTLSVLGFILVLGILVDDAIVIGERVYAHGKMGKDPVTAAIDGTYEVSVPVIFGVLTTMTTFIPVMSIPTTIGPFFTTIAGVVIIALFFSIVESQLILPSHLAYHSSNKSNTKNNLLVKYWSVLQGRVSGSLETVAHDYYRPALLKALEWRYLTMMIAICVVIITLVMLSSGRIVFQFFPAVEGSRLYATVSMPEGSTVDKTERAVRKIEAAAEQLRLELDEGRSEAQGSMIQHMISSIGAGLGKGSINAGKASGAHFAEVGMKLDLPPDYNGVPTPQIASRWRELSGDIPDAVEVTFTAKAFDAGAAIDIQLRGADFEQLKASSALLREALSQYPGVMDIKDTFRIGKQEVQLSLLPEARNLDLTVEELGRQVRQAFYGEEAQRIQRGRDDIRVMVRFPEDERNTLSSLENMRIRTKDGIEVPFASVAAMQLSQGYSTINREDGARVIRVIADVDRAVITPEAVLRSLAETSLKEIGEMYPGISYRMGGEAEENDNAVRTLGKNSMLALLVIYALLAIPLHSYLQPLVVMFSIPFGAIGAIIGHYLIGADLVFFSLLGMVALSGVVINASLVLVDYINRQRAEGVEVFKAVSRAGAARFRPIVLTSITTFAGLAPLINTPSMAVKFFMSMAISLAYGVLIATVITLFLVPAMYLILEDFHKLLARIKGQQLSD